MAAVEFVQVTYRELSDRFGIGIEGARLKAKRRAAKGEWRIIPGNHPQDIVRVEVPAEEFRVGPNKPPRMPTNPAPDSTPTVPSQQGEQHSRNNDLEGLVEVVSQLTTQSHALTERLIEAERARAGAERDTAIIQVEMRGLRAEMELLREAHLTELKALRDRLERDEARTRAELDVWKARRWWKRLAG